VCGHLSYLVIYFFLSILSISQTNPSYTPLYTDGYFYLMKKEEKAADGGDIVEGKGRNAFARR